MVGGVFFFSSRRRHTRLQGDWSSDVCSSDLTSAILQMTSSLGLRAVAEVVETQEAAQALLQMGCNFGQGYFFSAPVEAEQALEQLRRYVPPSTTAVPTVRAAAGDAGQGYAAGDTLVLADSPTVDLPESPTLVLSEEEMNAQNTVQRR